MDVTQLVQGGASAGVILALVKLADFVVKWVAGRRTEGANVAHRQGETAQLTTDAKVTESADDRDWVKLSDERVAAAAAAAEERAARVERAAEERVARAEATAARALADADACRRAAWSAQDAAAQCRRDTDALREQVAELMGQIRTCTQAGCPVRPLHP